MSKAWREKFPKNIEGRYRKLARLLQLLKVETAEKFKNLWEALRHELPPNFVRYLNENYIPNQHKWAQYSRGGYSKTTNFVESFHKQLKYKYMSSRRQRFDVAITALCEYSDDIERAIERDIFLNKSSNAQHKYVIVRRSAAPINLRVCMSV